MEIALRVVQFWSEIKLVITNRTPLSAITIINKLLELLNVVTNNFVGLQRSDQLEMGIKR